MLRTQKLGEADRIVTRAHPPARQGAGGRQGRAAHQEQVRRAARAVQPRRPAAVRPAAASTSSPRPSRSARTARRSPPTTPRYTAGTAVLETADRLTAEEQEPVAAAVPARRRGAAGAGRPASTPAPLVLDAFLLRAHVGRRLGAGADRLRPLRRARPAPALLRARGRHRSARAAGPPARRRRTPVDHRAAGGAAVRRLGRRRGQRRRASGARAAAWSPRYLQWHLERGLRSLAAGRSGT